VSAYRRYLEANRRPTTAARYGRVLRTFVNCYLEHEHADVKLLRDVRPQHVEEFKRRRAAGEVSEAPNEEDREREEALRLDLAKADFRKDRTARGKFGWLGRHGLRRKVSPRTINYELRCLATFFSWARRENIVFVNPAIGVEKFRVPKRALPRFMTSDQLRKFFVACDEREQRLYQTILLTGMRKGEAEHLNVG